MNALKFKRSTLISLFYLLTLALLAGSTAALIPSEQALEIGRTYLRVGEEASIASRPYLVDGKPYFVIYFHPQTNREAKNLIVVIDAENGALVEEQRTLEKVYSFDDKVTFLDAFTSEKKLSFPEMKTALQNGASEREQAESSLEEVESKLARIDENIFSVQTAFSQYTLQIERLTDEIDSGVETQELFEREYSGQALDALIIRFNSTLNALHSAVKSGEDYQKTVINASNQLTQKGVEQSQFKPGLQAAFAAGLGRFPSSASLQQAVIEFSALNSPEAARQINDSIQSYNYRRNKVDTDAAVNNVKPSVEEILRRKIEIQECTSISSLEKTWADTLKAQEKSQFGHVKGNVSLVETELGKVKRELDKCAESSSPPPTQKDNTNIFIGAVLLLLILYIVWKLAAGKKKQNNEEAELAASTEPTNKNLFSG